jgi:hypothetical protein
MLTAGAVVAAEPAGAPGAGPVFRRALRPRPRPRFLVAAISLGTPRFIVTTQINSIKLMF